MPKSLKKLTINQGTCGYRYNRDSFLLANFYDGPHEGHIADFCSGTGVISILLNRLHPRLIVTAIEIDPVSCKTSHKNALASGISKYNVVTADIKSVANLIKANSFDAIVANPPYRRAGSGRVNPDPRRAIARHEIKMTFTDLIKAATVLLKRNASLSFIMINERKKECIRILDEYGFSIARTQEIKSFGKRPPILFMVKATSGKIHETIIDKPLILKNSEGNDSRVFKKLMEKHV